MPPGHVGGVAFRPRLGEVELSGGFDIRVATPDDATAICTVQTRTWLVTYPSEELGITREGLRRHLEGEHGERIADRIAWTRMRIEGYAAEPDGWRSLVGDQAARLRDAERTSVVALPALATGPPAGAQRAGRGLFPADAAALPAEHVGDADGDDSAHDGPDQVGPP